MYLDNKDLRILRGKVYYENGLAAENIVVILDKILNDYEADFVAYTLTDEYGEYLFTIDDINCSYRVSAFEGSLNSLI